MINNCINCGARWEGEIDTMCPTCFLDAPPSAKDIAHRKQRIEECARVLLANNDTVRGGSYTYITKEETLEKAAAGVKWSVEIAMLLVDEIDKI